jgi:hypothetical protein
MGVMLGVRVSVGGAGVDVGSPAGTVSVGAAVYVTVAVSVNTTALGRMNVGVGITGGRFA